MKSHPRYLALGNSLQARAEAYKALFRHHVDPDSLKNIRDAWLTGTPLGNDYFREKIESVLARKVGQARRGRPSKKKED